MSTLKVSEIQSNTTGAPPLIEDSAGVQVGTFCRAWVNFNGTGTVAIRASFNVLGITDLGVGRYQVNFANAMPDANYAALTTGDNVDTATGVSGEGGGSPVAQTVSSVTVHQFLSDTNVFVDALYFNVAIFR